MTSPPWLDSMDRPYYEAIRKWFTIRRKFAIKICHDFESSRLSFARLELWGEPRPIRVAELISRSETIPRAIRRCGSRDDLANARRLIVDFTPVPEPHALAVGVSGLHQILSPSG
jgi:hypothetical protein